MNIMIYERMVRAPSIRSGPPKNAIPGYSEKTAERIVRMIYMESAAAIIFNLGFISFFIIFGIRMINDSTAQAIIRTIL